MKTLLIALLLITTQAHASAVARGEHGHHGATLGSSASHAAATGMVGAPAAQSGNGSRYSLVDEYQPWPQAEMAQFQKPHWTSYTGE
jgi:hypothetical protein